MKGNAEPTRAAQARDDIAARVAQARVRRRQRQALAGHPGRRWGRIRTPLRGIGMLAAVALSIVALSELGVMPAPIAAGTLSLAVVLFLIREGLI